MTDLAPGKIVEVLPWCPGWRPADRYGVVIGLHTRGVVVEMRQSGARVVYGYDEVELARTNW